jgi:hypothetical protein
MGLTREGKGVEERGGEGRGGYKRGGEGRGGVEKRFCIILTNL